MGAGRTLRTPSGLAGGRTRLEWLSGWGRSLASFLGVVGVSAVAAVAWMLARTGWGRYDLGTGDAVIALSVIAAAGPAWSAWQWLRLGGGAEGGTPPEASRWRMSMLMALHPAMLPLWLWATAILLVTGMPALALVALLSFTMFLTGGALMAGSVVLLLARPSSAPLHEWFARASFGGGR